MSEMSKKIHKDVALVDGLHVKNNIFQGLDHNSCMEMMKSMCSKGMMGKERPGHLYIRREWNAKRRDWDYIYRDAANREYRLTNPRDEKIPGTRTGLIKRYLESKVYSHIMNDPKHTNILNQLKTQLTSSEKRLAEEKWTQVKASLEKKYGSSKKEEGWNNVFGLYDGTPQQKKKAQQFTEELKAQIKSGKPWQAIKEIMDKRKSLGAWDTASQELAYTYWEKHNKKESAGNKGSGGDYELIKAKALNKIEDDVSTSEFNRIKKTGNMQAGFDKLKLKSKDFVKLLKRYGISSEADEYWDKEIHGVNHYEWIGDGIKIAASDNVAKEGFTRNIIVEGDIVKVYKLWKDIRRMASFDDEELGVTGQWEFHGKNDVKVNMENGRRKRLVYGTRSEKWELVGPEDRDYETGIEVEEFQRIGESRAREKYLSPHRIGSGNKEIKSMAIKFPYKKGEEFFVPNSKLKGRISGDKYIIDEYRVLVKELDEVNGITGCWVKVLDRAGEKNKLRMSEEANKLLKAARQNLSKKEYDEKKVLKYARVISQHEKHNEIEATDMAEAIQYTMPDPTLNKIHVNRLFDKSSVSATPVMDRMKELGIGKVDERVYELRDKIRDKVSKLKDNAREAMVTFMRMKNIEGYAGIKELKRINDILDKAEEYAKKDRKAQIEPVHLGLALGY